MTIVNDRSDFDNQRSFTTDRSSKIFIVLFFTILVIPILFAFLYIQSNGDYITTIEKRNPSAFPLLFKDNKVNTNFSPEFEKWLQDHIAFRSSAINLYNNIFQQNSTKVLYGENGYLFYKLDNAINNFKRNITLSDKQIAERIDDVVKIATDLKSKNIKFYWVIAPDKHTIYPEYFPKKIKRFDKPSVLDQILAYVHKQKLDDILNIIDLRSDLLAKKSEFSELYYKTDTHWNEIGAFIGHKQLMARILKDFPEGKFKKIPGFDKYEISESEINGDLAYMVARTLKSKSYVFKPKFSQQIVKETLDENHFITSNNKPILNKIAMIYRSSFFVSLQPFISNYFSKATFITDKIRQKNIDEIVQAKADVVIYEIVERKL